MHLAPIDLIKENDTAHMAEKGNRSWICSSNYSIVSMDPKVSHIQLSKTNISVNFLSKSDFKEQELMTETIKSRCLFKIDNPINTIFFRVYEPRNHP